jgi:long-chain fatty acid transport protein
LKLATAALAAATLLGAGQQALAGGVERGGYNIDQLFDPSPFSFDMSTTFVMPQRELKNAKDTNPLDGLGSNGIGGGDTSVRETENYLIPRFGAKFNIVDPVDCLFDYSQPWGAHTNPGANWVGANNNIETEINSNNFGATCSYKIDAGKGNFRLIGGAFWQEVYGFKDRLVAPAIALPPGLGLTGVGHLELSAEGYGYRAGIAYEIPEIAFRASLVYNSEVKLDDITGTLDLTKVNGTSIPVYGSTAMPDSLEFKLQSGIAPGWLAFGSVKWVDWSQLQTVNFCPTASIGVYECTFATKTTSLDLLYQDGWTISGGVGHKFNDMWSGALALTWDRGTSTGYGSLTDTWSVSGGVAFTPNERVEFRLGALAGILTSGSSGVVSYQGKSIGNDVSYDFGNDFVGALSLGARVKF